MPLAGAPHDLYMQLLAHSSLQSLVALACSLLPFCDWLFSHPSLPCEDGLGKQWAGKYSTEVFQCDGAWWGPLAGLPWIPPPHARAVPGSTNFVGTSSSIGDEFNNDSKGSYM